MNANQNSELYRTQGLAHEFFSQPGTLHLHVDGGDDPHLALNIVLQLERQSCPGKVNRVVNSIAGPQRASLPETYESHTPSTDGVEQFEYFATTWLPNRQKAVEVLRNIIPTLESHHGVVIEVERVIARIDQAGVWHAMKGTERIPPIEAQDVNWEVSSTLPFEIHHGFDLPLDSNIALPDLLKETTSLGVVVGGWFSFARRGRLSFRSNSFSHADGLREMVLREHKALSEYLQQRGFSCPLRTVVEEVLGVWRIAHEDSMAVAGSGIGASNAAS